MTDDLREHEDDDEPLDPQLVLANRIAALAYAMDRLTVRLARLEVDGLERLWEER